jgi:hypothetical protein
MIKNKIAFRVLGGIGNILWQISARVKRFGLENLVVIPGDKHAADACNRWLNKKLISIGTMNEGPIEGYFQDKYWLCPSNIIKNWLNLDVEVPEDIKQFKLVVHVRGGDFLTSAAHKHCHQRISYIKQICKTHSLSEGDVLIVTDDINAARNSLGTGWHCYAVKDDVQAFKIMMQAEILLVMPGSTFSWWAGYLNEGGKEGGIIYVPVGNWPCDGGALLDVTSTQQSKTLVVNDIQLSGEAEMLAIQ